MDIIKYDDIKKAAVVFSDAGAEWYGEFHLKPEIEQNLFLKQDAYYKEKKEHKKQAIWSDMFSLVQKYSKSLILKKNTNGRYIEPDEVDDQATQTALSFMSQYVYRPGYHVGASFAGMINPKVLETLFKHSKDDQCKSLHSVLGDTNLELEDIQEKAHFESLYANDLGVPGAFMNNVSLKDVFNSVLQDFNEKVKDELIRFKVLLYSLILLRKSKNKHIRPAFFKYITPEKKEYDLVQLFELELKNRLSS